MKTKKNEKKSKNEIDSIITNKSGSKKIILIKYVIAVFFFLLTSFLVYSVYKLGIVPNKYLFVGSFILLFLQTISNLCLFSSKKWLKGVAVFLWILLILFSFVGIKYSNIIDHFLDNSFGNAEEVLTLDYLVLSKNASYSENDLNQKDIYYYDMAVYIDKAIEKLESTYTVHMKSIDDIIALFDQDIFVVDKTTYSLFVEERGIDPSQYSLVYEFSIEYEVEASSLEDGEDAPASNEDDDENKTSVSEKSNSDYYNIYLGGYDFSGYRMDLNKIITINTKTNEILITNIHRYTYITIPAFNKKNHLSSTAYYGIQNNVEALENLFDIHIDYYVSVKTPGLVKLVDTIGGIEYCSDQAFTTSHAMVMGTYDDTKGDHLKVEKGCQHLNGIQTLTVAREREAFKMGATQRDKNTTAIMLDILYQMRSPSNITNYPSILNAVGGMYTTSIPRNVLTNGVKKLLNGGWTIKTQSLSGTNGQNKIHFSNLVGAVQYPDASSVKKCSNAMKALDK